MKMANDILPGRDEHGATAIRTGKAKLANLYPDLLRPRLRFQNGCKFVAGNWVASIAFEMTAYFFRRRLLLEPKLKGFADHLGTIFVGGFAGDLDCAQESLIATE
jgi:hypothetical protein